MSSTLEQVALPAERMTAYPLSRREAACNKWAIRMKVLLAKYGCAYVLTTAPLEIEDLDEKQRIAAEKVYGTLLDERGCLRRQLSLRAQLMRNGLAALMLLVACGDDESRDRARSEKVATRARDQRPIGRLDERAAQSHGHLRGE